MAKGQKKSNREVRKPKAPAAPKTAAPRSFLDPTPIKAPKGRKG